MQTRESCSHVSNLGFHNKNCMDLVSTTKWRKVWVYVIFGVCLSVRPSGHPSTGRIQKLNVRLFLVVIETTVLKLHIVITTIETYPWISIMVTFDLYQGHMVGMLVKWADERSFSFMAPRIWNCLPTTLHDLPTLSDFKSQLKTYFFLQAFLQHVWLALCVCGGGWVFVFACDCVCKAHRVILKIFALQTVIML